jgi:hypothetical protein
MYHPFYDVPQPTTSFGGRVDPDWVTLNPQPLPPRSISLAARGIIIIGG